MKVLSKMQSKEKVKSLHLGLTSNYPFSQTSSFKRSEKQTSPSSIGQSPIMPREFLHVIWSAKKLIPAIKVVGLQPYQPLPLRGPWFFSRVRRGASFRRPQAEHTSGVWPKPETAHLAPRVLQPERRLKSEFVFFQSLWRLFLPTYFVNCRRTVLKLNFKGPYSSSEREIKFRRCLFTSSIKREIRHFHIVVVQKRERNIQKKCDARAKLLFCFSNLLFLWRSRCRPRRWILDPVYMEWGTPV